MTRMSAISPEKGEKAAKPREKAGGAVLVDTERCKGCGFCIAFCPMGVLAMSSKFNAKGYHYPEVAHKEKCTGCGLCGLYCPDFAIYGVRLPVEDTDKE